MQSSASSQESPAIIVGFDSCNRLAVLNQNDRLELPFYGNDLAAALSKIEIAFSNGSFIAPEPQFHAQLESGTNDSCVHVYFSQIHTVTRGGSGIEFHSIESLENRTDKLSPELRMLLPQLDPHLLRIPYLHLGENDFIYKFRPEKERNVAIYANDDASSALYQSKLCELIKARARTREGSASAPVMIDFGPVAYHIPSHFGFCLGVKNAIERAYEALAANPGKRVFMLSELIHNPFVNADLLRRGLRYLQSDKGVPFRTDGSPATKIETSRMTGTRASERAPKEKQGRALLWDTLTSEDVVIIPAFGATDEDKRRLVRKGVAVCQYDATCMLVEKVWKAARNYGRKGYTVIIHGKAEHEETKATFSNTRRYAPALIVRDLAEVQQLARIISATTPEETDEARAAFYAFFKGKHTPDFDPVRDLARVAVVNQTTLLVNETRAIIDYLRERYTARYGAEEAAERVGGSGKNDTLCYATQVNQDALAKALEGPLDAAFVIGGTNSSNTYQLYRLCENALGERAHFIQSERDILSAHEVDHFVFPYQRSAQGHKERRQLWGNLEPKKHVLITGGASCPDGIIQQAITRLNSFFRPETLRPIDSLLEELAG